MLVAVRMPGGRSRAPCRSLWLLLLVAVVVVKRCLRRAGVKGRSSRRVAALPLLLVRWLPVDRLLSVSLLLLSVTWVVGAECSNSVGSEATGRIMELATLLPLLLPILVYMAIVAGITTSTGTEAGGQLGN